MRSAQQTRDIAHVLVQCWASVADDGPTLNQHMGNVPCLLGGHLALAPIRSTHSELISLIFGFQIDIGLRTSICILHRWEGDVTKQYQPRAFRRVLIVVISAEMSQSHLFIDAVCMQSLWFVKHNPFLPSGSTCITQRHTPWCYMGTKSHVSYMV